MQLLSADGGLYIRHPIVETEDRIRLENHLTRSVAHRVGNTHAVLTQETEAMVPLRIGSGNHPAVPRTHDFARMERKTGNVTVRPTNTLPLTQPLDLASYRAGGVLH